MNITLRQLRAFVTVADLSSFTEAARQLHLTQAALSVLVRELETSLGIRLLERSTRRVTLSMAGNDFYPFAEKILQDLETAVINAAGLKNKKRGVVRVAAPQLMACTLMPLAIAAYAKVYPDIQIRLSDTLPEQVLAKILSGEVEFGIGPDSGPEPEIMQTPLLRDHHLLTCTRDHALARKKRVSWQDMQGYPFIAPTRDFMTQLKLVLTRQTNDLAITAAYEVSYMTTALGMVNAGLGITACPSYAAPLVQAYELQMRPLYDPEFVREVCIFTRRATSLSPAAESFVDFLRGFEG